MKWVNQEAGFTLLELLIAIVLSTIIVLVVTDFMSTNLININTDFTKTEIQNNTKLAVDTVARTIRQARSVEANNLLPDQNSPGAPGNPYSWTGVAGSNATLILALPSKDASGNLIYVDGLHTQLYTDDIVYYLDPSSHRLYRRVIANQSAPANAAVTTCPPSKATAQCPSDADVVDDVANLTTGYLDANNNPVSSPSGTEAVLFTLTETKTVNKRTLQSSYTTVTAMRNR